MEDVNTLVSTLRDPSSVIVMMAMNWILMDSAAMVTCRVLIFAYKHDYIIMMPNVPTTI